MGLPLVSIVAWGRVVFARAKSAPAAAAVSIAFFVVAAVAALSGPPQPLDSLYRGGELSYTASPVEARVSADLGGSKGKYRAP